MTPTVAVLWLVNFSVALLPGPTGPGGATWTHDGVGPTWATARPQAARPRPVRRCLDDEGSFQQEVFKAAVSRHASKFRSLEDLLDALNFDDEQATLTQFALAGLAAETDLFRLLQRDGPDFPTSPCWCTRRSTADAGRRHRGTVRGHLSRHLAQGPGEPSRRGQAAQQLTAFPPDGRPLPIGLR